MNVLNNWPNGRDQNPLSAAELEAMAQFEASDRDGTALWRPRVSGDAPAPDCVIFVHKIGRFAIRFLSGNYSAEDGKWYHRSNDGEHSAVGDPMERVWQAAMAVKEEVTRHYDFGCYILAVAVFPDMELDQALVAAKGRRAVKMLWGTNDLVERIIQQLEESKRRPTLSAEYVEKDIQALTQGRVLDNVGSPEEVEVDLESGELHVHSPKRVVINVASGATVTINFNGAAVDDGPSSLKLTGR